METVYKYKLSKDLKQTIEMPVGAQILTCQIQHGVPVIWAKVNSKIISTESRTFILAETGGEIEQYYSELKYISTIQLFEGAYILHVFEIIY